MDLLHLGALETLLETASLTRSIWQQSTRFPSRLVGFYLIRGCSQTFTNTDMNVLAVVGFQWFLWIWLVFRYLTLTCSSYRPLPEGNGSHVWKLEVEMQLLINFLLWQPRSPFNPHKTKRSDHEPAVEKARYNSLSCTDSRAFSNPDEAVQAGVQPALQNTESSRNPIPSITSHSVNTLAQQDCENRSTNMSR